MDKNIIKSTKLAFIYQLLLALSLSIIFSCQKDVLERIPLSSYSDAVVWNDPALVDAYISRIYRRFPTGWNILANLSDENTRRNNVAYDNINMGNLTPSNFIAHANYWSGTHASGGGGFTAAGYWDPISSINIFFENIESADFDQDLKNRMIGEMKFLRAYGFFRLASFYGGVPLITRTFQLEDDFYVARNTYEEVMSFVLSELEEAIDLLSLDYPANQKGRITKGTAMAAKARALLYMASPLNNPQNDLVKWQRAADATKAVIDLGIYDLYPDYGDSYKAYEIYHPEIIWARLYNNTEFVEMRVELSHMPPGYYGYAHTHPLQNMVDSYERTNGLLPEDDPDYDPYNGQWENRDPRFYASILYDGAMYQGREVECFIPGGLDSYQGPIEAWNATTTGYYVRKFADENIIVPRGPNVGNSPWPHFRYNAVLLDYAECMFMLGDEEAAREYINKIRSRPSVNMPPVTESGEDLWERYVNERKVELYMESHRFFDVRRWKIAEDVLSVNAWKVEVFIDVDTREKTYVYKEFQSRHFPPHYYYLPIPQTEIERNPALVQNPGY
jgi:starch-binding outer membrane protein, SusD/RagB family